MNSMLVMTLTTLLGSSIPTINGDGLRVTISANPPLNGKICVGETITFTCHVLNSDHQHQYQYQWSIDEDIPKIGHQTCTIQVPSQSVFNVTCEVYAQLNNITSDITTYGVNTITVQPSGITPQIYFQYVTNNFVYKLTRRPFNLTATVVSNSNLTTLHWSPPESSDHPPSRTITVHHGNTTTTTFMLLGDATLGDSGNYTLTAVNECGENSSQIKVEVVTACPSPKFTGVQPAPNFTAVEGYNATMKCSYDGFDMPSSPLRVWVLFPHSQKPQYIDEVPYYDCKCWMEDRPACPIGTNPNDCCRFELIMHSTPVLKENSTVFSCTKNFSKDTAWMFVVPSPKVLEPPRNHNATVGSKAVFTCDFEASTDNKIAQIHWEFNGDDLAGCRRFQDRINCTVTQNSTDTNYISSTLEIYSVQAENAGQYTCYCSYDTRFLNVDAVQVIQSDRKSATLSLHSDSSHEKNADIIIIIGIVFSAVAIVLLLGSLIYCIRVHNQTHMGYISLEQAQSSDNEINDETLDRYVMEKLFPFWEKFGKALELPSSFLEKTYGAFPADPVERLRAILREWRATTDHPSVSTLNQTLEQLGLINLIPQ